MANKEFNLSLPYGGWMDITVKDNDTKIQFPVSYLCDPIYMLLNTFVMLLKTIVNVIKDNIYLSHSFLMDWENVMNDVMEQLTDEYINIYCCVWYDNQEEADEIKILKKKVLNLYEEVCQKRK